VSKAQIKNDSASYEDYKNVFLDYIKSNIVKSYLRLKISSVNFKDVEEPGDNKKKDMIKEISKKITHKRNVAFMYAYVLALYYNNMNLIPKTVNEGLEFEYALTKEAFNRISGLGNKYISKDPEDEAKDVWKIFKNSADYEELAKILNEDFEIFRRLITHISSHVQKLFKNGSIKPEKVDMIKNIGKREVFEKNMKMNQAELKKKSGTGVCGLIAEYIDTCLDPSSIENKPDLEFGPYYEKHER